MKSRRFIAARKRRVTRRRRAFSERRSSRPCLASQPEVDGGRHLVGGQRRELVGVGLVVGGLRHELAVGLVRGGPRLGVGALGLVGQELDGAGRIGEVVVLVDDPERSRAAREDVHAPVVHALEDLGDLHRAAHGAQALVVAPTRSRTPSRAPGTRRSSCGSAARRCAAARARGAARRCRAGRAGSRARRGRASRLSLWWRLRRPRRVPRPPRYGAPMIAAVLAAAALAAPQPQLLVVTETRGFVHDSIPAAKAMVASLGLPHALPGGRARSSPRRACAAPAPSSSSTRAASCTSTPPAGAGCWPTCATAGAFVGAHAAGATFAGLAGLPSYARRRLPRARARRPRTRRRHRPRLHRDAVVRRHRRVLQVPRPRQAPCRRARARRRSARVVAALRARARVLRRAGPLPGHVERAPPAPAHGRRDPLGAGRDRTTERRPSSRRSVDEAHVPASIPALCRPRARARPRRPGRGRSGGGRDRPRGARRGLRRMGGVVAVRRAHRPLHRSRCATPPAARSRRRCPAPSARWTSRWGPTPTATSSRSTSAAGPRGCDIRRKDAATRHRADPQDRLLALLRRGHAGHLALDRRLHAAREGLRRPVRQEPELLRRPAGGCSRASACRPIPATPRSAAVASSSARSTPARPTATARASRPPSCASTRAAPGARR